MKKLYSILAGLLIAGSLNAQSIISMTYSPVYPTSIDTIVFIIQNEFGSGSCDGVGYYNGLSGTEVSAGGLHCIGMLSVICDDYDTIVVPPLAAGNYSFSFTLVTAQQPTCIPGLLPIVTDTIQFSVIDATGINTVEENQFRIFPNPSNGNFTIKNISDVKSINVYSSEGKLIETIELNDATVNHSLERGIYYLVCDGKKIQRTKLIVTE